MRLFTPKPGLVQTVALPAPQRLGCRIAARSSDTYHDAEFAADRRGFYVGV